jgi:hypothetical protein
VMYIVLANLKKSWKWLSNRIHEELGAGRCVYLRGDAVSFQGDFDQHMDGRMRKWWIAHG